MKVRVADYIADFLVSKNVTTVYTVVGGGAMYLNDAFGNYEKLKCVYTHHEQAAAIAAEGHARVTGSPAAVCVTTGPGGTNAVTGVLGAYQDSIPMIVISGQVRYETTVESTGLDLRQFGEQECQIISLVNSITKYARMIKNPLKIRYYLEKAYWYVNEGRKGPVWLDIPLNVQNALIETDELEGYTPSIANYQQENISQILELMKASERPVILAGSGLRSSGTLSSFRQIIRKWKCPVVAATSVADIFPNTEPLYMGNFGVFGGRAGNYIVQNADLIVAFGCRMSFKQIGFNYEKFAPNAKKIVIDVDINELQKDTLKIDLPIHCNLNKLLPQFLQMHNPFENELDTWIDYCKKLKDKYPIYQKKYEHSEKVNQYYFIYELNKRLPDNNISVVGNSVASVCALQMGIEKEHQRLFGNVNCGSMGWDMPASVGASIASGRSILCLTGDGSIQMNLQELQTIVTNDLPIKIIIFNNGGYQAIIQSQTNFFQRLSGCTEESGLKMPSFQKIAEAYGFPYIQVTSNMEVVDKVRKLMEIEGYAICEVLQDVTQNIEPRVKSKRLEDGTMTSPPIDDLCPFLSEEENRKNQFKI
ncbi:MAG: thiamine pyrophosphate-binding protein [Lachnospiraceae bacterium]|nr:thiamine pyrophosphate-binding protein [Lachnospiraceae bacterium]MDE7201687.1 thiamine pyrophosphate-binding protein [Lachnospiraceae bacterium]